MVIPELGYVPLWDGRVYANCVMDAAASGLTMESLRCANHPSQGWAFVLALPQIIVPGSVEVLHLTNLLLGIIAVGAFRIVLARVVPDPARARELDLVMIAAAVHPVVVSTLLQPNVDFGVYAYFFMALAGLLTPVPGGTLAAIVSGTLLVFSKETGVVAYGVAVVAAIALEHHATGETLQARTGAIVRRGALLSVPLVAFGAHVLEWNATHDVNAIWRHGWQESSADGFKFFDLSEPIALSYAAGLFVLGFMWVVWLPTLTDGVLGLVRIARRQPTREVSGAHTPTLAAVVLLTVILTYVLTSFRTWSNLRYFALLYPLFLLLAYVALLRLRVSARGRIASIATVIVLFVVADYRSVDPLSRLVYGTFDTGARRMYRMSSITGEFEGPGRDQLVYNLEFTGYHHAQNALFQRILPTSATVIGAPRHVRWNIWTQLDSASRSRTMRRTGVITPVYADEFDIPARQSREAWLLDFSNHGDNDRALASLLPTYDVTDSAVVTSSGQRLVARHLVRRQSPALP
jgi:hypothetical protein